MHLNRLYIDIPAIREGSVGAYLLAVCIVALAAGLRIFLEPYVSGVQFITFFPAVIITTLLSGWRAGALSVMLSTLAAWLLILHPQGQFASISGQEALALALFFVVAAMDVLFIGSMRLAIRRRNELNATLEARVQERTRELVAFQQQLAHAEKLQALGQLTGGMAHDFNNMLAIIIGNLTMATRRRAANNQDIDQLIANAIIGAERASELTKRLLAYARKQPLAPAPTDVNKACESVTELLRRTVEATISIECVRAGGLWKAFVDSPQLENAIVNLALNARDAMPTGGRLTIETANAYLDEEYAAKHTDVSAGQYVLVSVSDSGMGMSPEVASKATEPFFTTKADGKGSGLGLSQVFGFIKQSSGHFAMYSEAGRGTTVRLYLPRFVGSEVKTEPPEKLPARGQGSEAVLVVEDDAEVRLMCTAALKDLGYEVLESASGAEALQQLERSDGVRVLLTDVVMPGMNGRQLAEQAMKRHPGIRVLYMTGYSRNAIVHNSMLDPGVQLLVKPFTVDQLAKKIREVLTF